MGHIPMITNAASGFGCPGGAGPGAAGHGGQLAPDSSPDGRPPLRTPAGYGQVLRGVSFNPGTGVYGH